MKGRKQNMVRDMKKTAEKAESNIPDNYDIYSNEIKKLMEQARCYSANETYKAIITAFNYGFVMGHRATLAGKVKKRL